MELKKALKYLKEKPKENKISRESWCSVDGGTYLIYDDEKDKFVSYSYNTIDKGNIDTEVTKGLMKLFGAEDDWVEFPTQDMLKTYVVAKNSEIIKFLRQKGFVIEDVIFDDSQCTINFRGPNRINPYTRYSNQYKGVRSSMFTHPFIKLEGDWKTNKFEASKFYQLSVEGYKAIPVIDVQLQDIEQMQKDIISLGEAYEELVSKFDNIEKELMERLVKCKN